MIPQTRSIDWRRMVLEAFFVVLGVVLALAANEWRRGYNDRQNAELALAAIREELFANRRAVLDAEQYHRALADTLTALLQRRGGPDPEPPLPDARLFGGGFVRPASLLHTAWDAAGAADAVRHLRYTDLLLLARIYEEQQEYRQQAHQVGQLIYTQLFAEGVAGVLRNYANLASLISTFWYRECQLLFRYDEVLPQLSGGAAVEALPLRERCREVPRR